MNVTIVEGNLLDQNVDVIVNTWNRNIIPWWLLLPQGVSGAIKKRGGTGLPVQNSFRTRCRALAHALYANPGRRTAQIIEGQRARPAERFVAQPEKDSERAGPLLW